MDVKKLRLALGLTQEQLGHKIGVSFVTISRWERDVCTPSPMALRELARLEKQISKQAA